MATEIKIPQVGESITEVQISEWLKAEGDPVQTDEAVAVIDSEKTTFDLSAPEGGRLTKILHQAGETVKVGEAVAQIEATQASEETKPSPENPKAERKNKAESEAKSEEQSVASKSQPAAKETASETETKRTAGAEEKRPASEARSEAVDDGEAAREEELKTPKQRELPEREESEVATEAESTASSSDERDEEVVPMTMLRRTVARRLVEAQQTMAMLTTFNEVDMSAAQALRKEFGEKFEKRHQVRLGLMSFFVKATIDALKQFPKLNAEIRETDIVYRNYFDVGVAISTDRGLVVPVLRRAERMSFAEVEKSIAAFAQRAREGKLKPADLEGGTFTITNGGVFGSLLSTPIINPPQTGILGMHTIQERPVAVNGQVVIRPMMYVALSYDHRLVDGREAVLFLRRIKEAIENPARMLIEI